MVNMFVHSLQGTYTMYGPSIYHYLVHLMCGGKLHGIANDA